MKATAIAPSNIAFIKYWGRKDEKLRLPSNGSISMNLSNLLTTTTVEFSKRYAADSVTIDGKTDSTDRKRVIEHLDRIRRKSDIKDKAKVVSQNNFPVSTGLSSSASGFAALTLAGSIAAGLNLNERDLSILARQASGSACRSIPDGFVEWFAGTNNDDSYSMSIYPANWWNICDIVVLVSTKKKDVPSTLGQSYARSSPFFEERLKRINIKIKQVKKLIKERDFVGFGDLIEREALELHAIMLTSKPALIYWQPETLTVIKRVGTWRKTGIPVYFTLNTGQDIHLICLEEDIDQVKKKLKEIEEVKDIIINKPAKGARLIQKHLF